MSTSLSDKSTKIEQPKEIKFRSEKFRGDSPSVSIMSRHGASITTALPDKECIPYKIKRKKVL